MESQLIIDPNSKKNMDLIIKIIKRGGIKNMTKYFQYSIINKRDLEILLYDPSFSDVFYRHKVLRHFQFNNIFNTYALQSYSRLLRFGKENYLDYVTYIGFYNHYVCDVCDINKTGQRYKCMECFEVDICFECHIETHKKCPSCNNKKLFIYNKKNIYPRCSKITI